MPEQKKTFTGLSQYKIAFCYELAGKKFHIVMDNGTEYLMDFTDESTVLIAEEGKQAVYENYECLKGDDRTYLVRWAPKKHEGKINRALVLDLRQNLVTYVNFETGYDPEYPRLIRAIPYFGAIKVPGEPLPTIRHHLSARMAGRHIKWHYTPGMNLQHIYYSPTVVRASPGPGLTQEDMLQNRFGEDLASDDPDRRARAEAGIREFKERNEWYPFYEEECFHVWISDRLNLFCFVEENMTMRSPGFKSGGGGILLLQDIERCVDVGVSFSAGEYYMCTAFGEENNIEDPLDSAESPFDWTDLKCMPSVHWEIPED